MFWPSPAFQEGVQLGCLWIASNALTVGLTEGHFSFSSSTSPLHLSSWIISSHAELLRNVWSGFFTSLFRLCLYHQFVQLNLLWILPRRSSLAWSSSPLPSKISSPVTFSRAFWAASAEEDTCQRKSNASWRDNFCLIFRCPILFYLDLFSGT